MPVASFTTALAASVRRAHGRLSGPRPFAGRGLGFLVCAVIAGACGGDALPAAGKTPPVDPCEERDDGWFCEGGAALRCAAKASEERVTCEGESVCEPALGCVTCAPNTRECADGALRVCREDGSDWRVVERCEEGMQCTLLGCADLCAKAAEERSYIGCEYWPTTLANESLDDAFEPAVAVGNPNLETTRVTLERGAVSMTVEVGPGEIEVLPLPFVAELKDPFARQEDPSGAPSEDPDFERPRSTLIEGGAYHLTSEAPVTVHQFNPLEYQTKSCGDPDNQETAGCFSYTNDASLLLPTTAMTGNYVAVTRPTLSLFNGSLIQHRPGFVAIVGTQDEPTEVTVRVRAHVAASAVHSAVAFEALVPGETLTVELGAGDVLQLASDAPSGDCPGETSRDPIAEELVFCDPGEEFDLTGSEIHASAPIAVLAGHDCSFVPFDRWACDHLEETMFPVESWGRHLVVTRPAREAEGHRIKVVSATDGNRIKVEPALGQEVLLDRGESFEWESKTHVVVQGDQPISVAQFLLGQGTEPDSPGDPSMSLAIPSDQYKRSYGILIPETYDEVYVNLVSAGTSVMLDGYPVAGFVPIGESGYGVVRQRIDRAGLHTIDGGALVGVVVYGFARYTSYMVPGGLDLNLLQEAPF